MVSGVPYSEIELETIWNFGMKYQGRKTPWTELVSVVAAMGTPRSKSALTQAFNSMLKKRGMTETYRNTKADMVKERRYSEGLIRAAEWQSQNPVRDRAKAKRHRDAHSEDPLYKAKKAARHKRALPAANSRARERRKTDGVFRAIKNARCRLWHHYTRSGKKKCAKTCKVIGCTRYQLRNHIAEQLQDDDDLMDKEIDHIFPFARYTFGDNNDQIFKVGNYRNMQPLTTKENNNKHDKLPTKAMAAKVDPAYWPDGITEDMLPDIYPGWATPLRM